MDPQNKAAVQPPVQTNGSAKQNSNGSQPVTVQSVIPNTPKPVDQASVANVQVAPPVNDSANGNPAARVDAPPDKKPEEKSSKPSVPATPASQIEKLVQKVSGVDMPEDLKEKADAMIERLRLIQHETNFFMEYDSAFRYIDWIVSLPWGNVTQDILDLNHAKQVLDEDHYGLLDVKEKIMEYLSVMILQKSREGTNGIEFRAPTISLIGLPGVGKTTIAYSIARALGRKIERIPFGGMGAAKMLRGESRFSPDAEPGLIMKALRRAGSANPILLLDEIDRVSEYALADIMGVLVELLDPEQNKNFSDHFIDYPFDMSKVFFITTSNNTKNISTAVLDRLEVVQMPSYTDAEKIVIAKSYILPQTLKESGLTNNDLMVADDAWAEMVRALGYDSGVRSLKRTVQGMVRKVALFILQGRIPSGKQFLVTAQNMKEFVSAW